MLKVFHLYSVGTLTCMKTHVDAFAAFNSDKAGDEAKNLQAEQDMFAYMESHPGLYAYEVFFDTRVK